MKNPFEDFFMRMDQRTEKLARNVAQSSGRRSFLGKLGAVVAGSALMPVLPFDHSSGVAWADAVHVKDADGDDITSCDYWRYCAMDGNMCNECGGTLTSCPPGSEASKVSWVGTCHNPHDDKDYLVAYNDCCGKAQCTGTECIRSERERPGYRMGLHNDINWCMANASQGYHCTVAVLVGLADE